MTIKLFPLLTPLPFTCPPGWDEVALRDWLAGFSLDNADPSALRSYLDTDFRRFLLTLSLVPPGSGRLLEVGSNPYFTTLLLRRFTSWQVQCLNYFEGLPANGLQTMVNAMTGERYDMSYPNLDMEVAESPWATNFEVVLCCEVIEHLIRDPLQFLLRLHRSLVPGGTLILSTPNVCRLENVARMLAGVNIYDPYSHYGPHGRHNREYNKHDLHRLLTHAGFTVDLLISSDVHDNHAGEFYDLKTIAPLVAHRGEDLGQYLFCRARATHACDGRKPSWLYRSYPPEQLI